MSHTKFLSIAWGIGIILIVLCYCFVDRPLASFIHSHDWQMHLAAFRNIIEWPPVATGLSPFILLFTLLFRTKPEAQKWQLLLITLSISILFAYVLKNDLKWIFSRYWPETWTNNNLSWINNHTYGFQWFQGEPFQGLDTAGSFPSGHSTIAFATLIPIGLYYRRILWLCILLASLEALPMVAFNYHFLSDIIAGSLLGSTCAILVYDFTK